MAGEKAIVQRQRSDFSVFQIAMLGSVPHEPNANEWGKFLNLLSSRYQALHSESMESPYTPEEDISGSELVESEESSCNYDYDDISPPDDE